MKRIDNERICYLPDGIIFDSGPDRWEIGPTEVPLSQWIVLAPEGLEPVTDPSVAVSRILAAMLEPINGTVELFGFNVYRMSYGDRQRLRAKLGFVHGYGGLLSNRNIFENIELPISVHSELSEEEKKKKVHEIICEFGLEKLFDRKPHEVDGSTRWNVCLARSLVLSPKCLILEGIGNWEMDRGRSIAWNALSNKKNGFPMSVIVCMSRHNPEFEKWFENIGGRIIQYHRIPRPDDRRLLR